MRNCIAGLLLFLFCTVPAQRNIFEDSLKLTNVTDFLVDDYRNFYFYKKQNFSLTKFDSLGKQKGRQMLTLPFKVQNVQNPMNIVLFSENAQEIRFLDQNLNEVQKLDLRRFGFVRMAYAEDLQQIWLLDESARRLVQYDFRADKIRNSYSFNISFEDIKDLIVFEQNVYVLRRLSLDIYDFQSNILHQLPVEEARKLRRENERFFIFTDKNISLLNSGYVLQNVFEAANGGIVDKNSAAFFEVSKDKVYLYPIIK